MSDDIDPERKFSNPSDWDNYIDDNDASDGSDGGLDLNGYRITARAMIELVNLRMENTRLRAELAAVTEERDRMRDALRPFADAVDIFIAENHDAHRTIVTLGDFFHARAVLDVVTKKRGAENE